jgi:CO/xanthine dehydrogenase Mo-binding subunit
VRAAAARRAKVRFVGDAVAVVVAETRAAAMDAAEAVVVEYDPLPAVADPEAALAPGARCSSRSSGRTSRPRSRRATRATCSKAPTSS